MDGKITSSMKSSVKIVLKVQKSLVISNILCTFASIKTYKRMEKKYELTDKVILQGNHVLHRIKALRDFGHVKTGDLGGWIEKEDNLSHEGDCWVDYKAKVYGNARVDDNAQVYGNARVYGNAWVYGQAEVCDNAQVYGNAEVYGKANVIGNAEVCDNAQVYGNADVCDNAQVYGNADVCDNAQVYGNAEVCDNAQVYGNAEVYGNAWVYDNPRVYDNAQVYGNAEIGKDAEIKEMGDYMVFQNTWSSGRWFTWTRSNHLWKVGCFCGTGEELIKKAYKDRELSGKCYEAIVKVVETIEALK